MEATTIAKNTLVIVLLGAPGCGKGSQASLLKAHYQLPHLSSGNLLRAHLKEAASQKKSQAGHLIDDTTISAIIGNALDSPEAQRGSILDGFPRTTAQAEFLEKKLPSSAVLVVIYLKIEDRVIFQRISQRRICRQCQHPYHLSTMPPILTDRCDLCAGELYQREDDQPAVIQVRLQEFAKKTMPLLDFYEKRAILKTVDSDLERIALSKKIIAVIDQTYQERV